MRYRDAVEALIAELRANPKINVLEATLPEPADPEEIALVTRELRERSRIELPQGMQDLYAELDGFTLLWEPKPDIKVIDPELIVSCPDGLTWRRPPCCTQWLPIHSLRFGRREGEVFWGDDTNVTAGIPFLIDHDQEDQGSWLVSIDDETYLYYIHSQGEDVDRLALDFEAFFAKFIALRGFFCWQEMLTGEAARSERWMAALFGGAAP